MAARGSSVLRMAYLGAAPRPATACPKLQAAGLGLEAAREDTTLAYRTTLGKWSEAVGGASSDPPESREVRPQRGSE